MACNNCKDNDQIPQHSKEELAFAFLERMVKRMWIALIICIALIFASNACWIYAWMQYDYSSEETIYQQDGEGTNIIGDSNEVDNYGAESDNSEAQDNP
jgi:hypothetical protein